MHLTAFIQETRSALKPVKISSFWVTEPIFPQSLALHTFGFLPNSHSLFLVLLVLCLGSGRGPVPPSFSLSPLGVLLMVASEPVLLRFWLKSSKG